jgi:hypothetical protein
VLIVAAVAALGVVVVASVVVLTFEVGTTLVMGVGPMLLVLIVSACVSHR